VLAKVPARPVGRGTFAALRSYIADATRASHVVLSENLLSLETAPLEMEALAARAPRCKDPIYHFVLSWQAGEIPSQTQVVAASRYALGSLGMAGHQHIIATHTNTQHVHAHIAVSRIAPESERAVGLGFDYFRLDAACREIERHQGWSQERGPFRMEVNEAGERRLVGPDRIFDPGTVDRTVTREITQWRGEASFAEWVRGEPVRAVDALLLHGRHVGWADVHRELARFNLAYARRDRGERRGAVVIDRDEPTRYHCAASAASPGLAIGEMERRLGRLYEPLRDGDLPSDRSYRSEIEPRHGTEDLRARFMHDFLIATSPDRSKARNAAWRSQRESERARLAKAVTPDLAESIVREREALRRRFAAPPQPTWRGWLQREAAGGDMEALAALAQLGRAREEFDAPLLMSPGVPLPPRRMAIRGTRYLSHRLGIDYVDVDSGDLLARDTGGAVYFADRSARGISVGLTLAREKWHETALVVTGEAPFQRRVREAAAKAGVKIVVDTPAAPVDRTNLVNAEAAYGAHRRDIESLAPYKLDPSRVDRTVALRMRATGFEPDMVRAVMAQSRIASDRGVDYADRLVDYAFAPAAVTGAVIADADFDRFRSLWSQIEVDAIARFSAERDVDAPAVDAMAEAPQVDPVPGPQREDVDLVALAAQTGKPFAIREAEPSRQVSGVLVALGSLDGRDVGVFDAGRSLDVLPLPREFADSLLGREGESFIAKVATNIGKATVMPTWEVIEAGIARLLNREREQDVDIASTLGATPPR
jgi:hypothetical protein